MQTHVRGNSAWLAFASLTGLAMLAILIHQIPGSSFNRDWTHDYISGKAALAGMNPWEPFHALTQKFPELGSPKRNYSNPHPPVALLLSIPFCFLPYFPAAVFWLLAELGALMAALSLMGRMLGISVPNRFGLLATLCLLVWPPAFTDLANGQYQCFALLLLMLMWMSLRSGKEAQAGAWLGAAIALKMAGLLFIPWALYRRQWKFVVAAGLSWMACHLAAAAVIGWKWCWLYYTEVAAKLNQPFLTSERNFSVYALGHRMLIGTSGTDGVIYPNSSLIAAPRLAGIVSAVLLLGTIAVILWRTAKSANPDHQFAVLMPSGAICLPVTWDYYLLLALPGLLLTLTTLKLSGVRARRIVLLVAGFSVAGNTLIDPLWRNVSAKGGVWLSFLPLVGSLWLIFFLLRKNLESLSASAVTFDRLMPVQALLTGMFLALLIHAALPLAVTACCLIFALSAREFPLPRPAPRMRS